MSTIRNWYFNLEDVSQIAIGSFALAVPISFSEEAWRLSETLPTFNLIIIFVISIGFLTLFTYQSVFQANLKHRYRVFVFRIIAAYIIAALVVALVLWSLDKFPILSETATALKRLIVITMPASMGAIIVDALDKE
jgi:uncharacterized membrane protein